MSTLSACSPFPKVLLSFFLISWTISASFKEKNDFLECLISNREFQSSISISQVIYTPESDHFDHECPISNTTQENSIYDFIFDSSIQNLRPTSSSPLRPILIMTPTHESQIQAAVYCSRKIGIQIRVRSGGHDYEGLSYVSIEPFIIVDMRNYRSVSIDTESNTSWVQTGATAGEFYYAIAEKSKTLAFPGGICPTVGIGGHFSGGGYGMLSRKYRMAIDNIIDAKIINADGQILDRKSMGEDLFWAIRGGGGASFGIILSFKVKLGVIPETLTVFQVDRMLDQNVKKIIHRWQYVADKIDEKLFMNLAVTNIVVPENGMKQLFVHFNILFLGRVDDLIAVMEEQFPELGLSKQDCMEVSWIESVLLFLGSPGNTSLESLKSRVSPFKVHFKGKSDYANQPISETGLTGLWKFLDEEDDYQVVVMFNPYGGRINDLLETDTPFPHRGGNIFMIDYLALWENPGKEESQRHMERIRRIYDYMEPYVSKSPRAAYFNYRDLDIGMNHQSNASYEQASVWGFRYFKNNFRRLACVKTKVDPTNFFRDEQSIPVMSTWEMEECNNVEIMSI